MSPCRVLATSAFLLVTAIAPPASASTARIYVTNSAGDNVDVVDPATNKVVQVIKGIEAPHGINFSPDGSRVYVSNEADSTLDVVDRKSGKLIVKVALSGHPNNIAVTKDGGRVVVGIAEDPGALDIVDTKALARTKSVPVRGRLHNVYVTPDSKYVVTGSVRSKVLTVIDLATEEPVWWIQFDAGVRPMAIEAGPDGSTKRIFVQLSNLHGFSVVDFATHKEVDRIKLPDQPSGFGIQEGRVDTPSHGIAVAPDGKTLWVTSVLANAVFSYSLPDLKLRGYAALPALNVAGYDPIGALPDWITFTPDSKTVYVSNSGTRSVSAVDASTLKVVKTIAVGEVPKRLNTLVLP
ncbi:MAG TPA: cytochrome D1 domain-containing protein [Alphaproteobacteria bacterium]